MRTLFVVASLLAAVAFAGTRWVQTTGQLPSAATDGVSLIAVTACRGSVRYTDGGTVAGGKLQPYYYDSILGWIEGASGSACALDSAVQIDGGTRRAQVCEFTIQNQFGRAALVPSGLTPQNIGIVRLDCYGANVPQMDGGAR